MRRFRLEKGRKNRIAVAEKEFKISLIPLLVAFLLAFVMWLYVAANSLKNAPEKETEAATAAPAEQSEVTQSEEGEPETAVDEVAA